MVMEDISIVVRGCYCQRYKDGLLNVLQYSPFTGEELYGSFLYELEGRIGEEMLDNPEYQREFSEQWYRNKEENYPIIDISSLPAPFMPFVEDRSWYYDMMAARRTDHKDGEFCCWFECFISDCYSTFDPLPKVACVPIQYCPFCGVKLSAEFDQENWWEKEFKTFKWYKDRKMGEWADDYVDDHDWTEDVYPPVMKNGFAYKLAPRANRFEKRIVHKYKPLGDKRWQLIEEIDPETGELLNVVKDGKIRVEDWEERK